MYTERKPEVRNGDSGGCDIIVAEFLPYATYGTSSVVFEPNRGQADHGAKFLARGHGYAFFVTAGGAVLQPPGDSTQDVRESGWFIWRR